MKDAGILYVMTSMVSKREKEEKRKKKELAGDDPLFEDVMGRGKETNYGQR